MERTKVSRSRIALLAFFLIAGAGAWMYYKLLQTNNPSGTPERYSRMEDRQIPVISQPAESNVSRSKVNPLLPQTVPEEGVGFLRKLRSQAVNETNQLSFEEALAWPDKFTNRIHYIIALSEIIGVRGSREPHKLLAWYKQRDAKQEVEITKSVARVLGTAGAVDVADFAELGKNVDFGKAFLELSMRNYSDRFEDYFKVVENSPNKDKDAFLSAGAKGLLESEKIMDSIQLSRRISDVPMRASITGSASFEWAMEKPREAADWVKTLEQTDPEIMDSVTGSVVSGWYQHDPEAASIWCNSLPEGIAKDQARVALATQLSSESFEEATVWASAIVDANLKSKTLAVIEEAASRRR